MRWAIPRDSVPRLEGLTQGSGPEIASVFQADPGGRLTAETNELASLEDLTLAPDVTTADANSEVSGPSALEAARPHATRTSEIS